MQVIAAQWFAAGPGPPRKYLFYKGLCQKKRCVFLKIFVAFTGSWWYIVSMKSKNEKLAEDAWVKAMPEEAYDPCPCGCGKAFRFIVRDEATYNKHLENFVKKFLDALNAIR